MNVYTPFGNSLISSLSISISENEDLIIMGEPGSGKSSILRVLAGVWPSFDGIVRVPKDESRIFYLPQRPYLFEGNLAQQIMYPVVSQFTQLQFETLKNSDIGANLESIEKLLDLVILCGFENLLGVRCVQLKKSIETFKTSLQFQNSQVKLEESTERHENESDLDSIVAEISTLFFKKHKFADILSPGEQQMLSFARLFWHKPTFAILDEATSSLSERTENNLYSLCKQKFQFTLISTAHRKSIVQFHKFMLTIQNSSKSFTLEKI